MRERGKEGKQIQMGSDDEDKDGDGGDDNYDDDNVE